MLFKKNTEESKDNTKHNIENIFKTMKGSALAARFKNVLAKTKEIALVAHEKTADRAKTMKTGTMYAVSSGMIVFFVVCGIVGSNLTIGYRVVADGEVVGVVSQKEDAELACEKAVEALKEIKGTEEPIGEVKVQMTLANQDLVQNGKEVASTLVAAFDDRLDGYGIFVDGSLVVAMSTEDEAKEALELYQLEFVNENTEKDTVAFNKNVELKTVKVKPEFVKNTEDALVALKAPKDEVVKHIIAEGDTFYSLAEKYNTTVEKLMAYNPDVQPELLQNGQEVFVTETTPLLQVQTRERIKATESFDYETEKVNDPDAYVGVSVVTTEGVPGEKEVEYQVVKENGVEISKIAIAETVVKDPVTAVVRVGTKERPSTASTGTFATPYNGIVTSRFGSRWGSTHTGIDLAGATGSPVVAADGGTVISAGWGGRYGNLIKIRHDNGYETYYAHLSVINVSVGQKVAKREFIGRVGSTGNSTGPHLHFEIRKNGTPLNPANYMN